MSLTDLDSSFICVSVSLTFMNFLLITLFLSHCRHIILRGVVPFAGTILLFFYSSLLYFLLDYCEINLLT